MYSQKFFVSAGFAFGLCFGVTMRAQSSEELPQGKGKAQFIQICSQCHGLEMATNQKNTADGWSAVVDDMVSRGAQGSDDDFELVVAYLGAHFGPKVDINKADEKELSSKLGISSVDAEAIVHYRGSSGVIKDWSDLEKVPHIDIKKLAGEKDRIAFSDKAKN